MQNKVPIVSELPHSPLPHPPPWWAQPLFKSYLHHCAAHRSCWVCVCVQVLSCSATSTTQHWLFLGIFGESYLEHSFGLIESCLLEMLCMCARWLNSSQGGVEQRTGKASFSQHKVSKLQLFLSLQDAFVVLHQLLPRLTRLNLEILINSWEVVGLGLPHPAVNFCPQFFVPVPVLLKSSFFVLPSVIVARPH